jgi:hypothetical protein
MRVEKYLAATSAAALLCAVGGAALAQTQAQTQAVRSGAMAAEARAAAASAGIPSGLNPDYGLAAGDWLLYPSLFAGFVYNDNIYNTAANRRSGVGVRFRPSIQVERDTGIHRTDAYARADIQVYPGHGQTYQFTPSFQTLASPTNVTANVGFSHAYKPLPDLKFTLYSDFTRGSGGVFGGGYGLGGVGNIPNAVSLVGLGSFSNQVTGGAAVDKQFGNGFVRLSGNVQHVFYDMPANNAYLNALLGSGLITKPPSATNIYAAVRGGYWVTPLLYTFVESGADIRRSSNWRNDTDGYRVIGGVGSDLIGLFQGEVFGGVASQASSHGFFGARTAPTFGGRLSYYPTRQLTLAATIDQSFTAPGMQGVSPFGFLGVLYTPTAATRTLQAKAQADYKITDYWNAYARLGWGQSRSSGYYNYGATFLTAWTQPSSVTIWGAGAGMSYTFWRNIALTFEYNFAKSIPNNPNNLAWWTPTSVTQNTVSAGLTYKY